MRFGVESQTILRGDFEITLAYELIAVPKPGPEGGAGVVLEAHFDAPESKARLARTQKLRGAFFGSTYYARGNDGKRASIAAFAWAVVSIAIGLRRRAWSRLMLMLLAAAITLTPWTIATISCSAG